MTKYSLDYFDSTTGILEQLVLAVVAQEHLNREYLTSSIETDFTTSSVVWNAVINDNDSAYLNISITFPFQPTARKALLDLVGLDRRIMSINPNSINDLGLPHKSSYGLNSYPVTNYPAYLQSDTTENILERRIVWLCLQIIAVQGWCYRWNKLVASWVVQSYRPASVRGFHNIPDLATIDIAKQRLIDELTNGFTFTGKYDSFESRDPTQELFNSYLPIDAEGLTNSYSAAVEQSGFNERTTVSPDGGVNFDDSPTSDGVSNALSQDLLNQIQDAENANSATLDPTNNFTPQNTLPDC